MLVSTHLYQLLRELRNTNSDGWASATVVSKQRSSYRFPGAMMLINPEGESLGLVSGGCLEADIRLNARKVLAFGQSKTILYDSMDEENIAAELGLGCNGRVEVLVQPLSVQHRHLLLQLLERMEGGLTSYLLHCFRSQSPKDLNALTLLDDSGQPLDQVSQSAMPDMAGFTLDTKHQLLSEGQRSWSLSRYLPPINLWVLGGGVDAIPLVNMAVSLGWRVTLVDHRPAYAHENDFELAERVIRQRPEEFELPINANAAILMTHNLNLDAAWLKRLDDSRSLRYVGLLGPVDRRNEAIELAQLETSSGLLDILHGPMGFDIGGDIPESVALSTLAQCHQVLFKQELRRGA